MAKDVLEIRQFHDNLEDVCWENCSLRTWLNGEFLDGFATEEKEAITVSTLPNEANAWFGTSGGNPTADRIFLPDIRELVAFFGDSGQFESGNQKSKYFINDKFNNIRRAYFNGFPVWWWLRSPGLYGNNAADCYKGGSIHLSGHRVCNSIGGGGVRPALRLKNDASTYFM